MEYHKIDNRSWKLSNFLILIACICTLIKSVGDARNCATAPDTKPQIADCL